MSTSPLAHTTLHSIRRSTHTHTRSNYTRSPTSPSSSLERHCYFTCSSDAHPSASPPTSDLHIKLFTSTPALSFSIQYFSLSKRARTVGHKKLFSFSSSPPFFYSDNRALVIRTTEATFFFFFFVKCVCHQSIYWFSCARAPGKRMKKRQEKKEEKKNVARKARHTGIGVIVKRQRGKKRQFQLAKRDSWAWR